MRHSAAAPDLELTSGRTLVRSTGWNIAGQTLPLLAAFVAIPVALRGLGTERFGALSLAWLLIGYASLFDLGLGRALTKLAAEKLAERRDAELGSLVWTALALMLGLGLAGALAIGGSASWLVRAALRVPDWLQEETRQALLVLASSVPFVVSTAGLRGLLEARQRFALVNAVRVPQGVLTFLAPALVVPFSQSLVHVFAVLALLRALTWAVHLALCLRVFPVLRHGIALSVAQARPLAAFGGWLTVSNIVNPVLTYADRFLIGALVSLPAVAFYATPYEVVTKVALVPGAVGQVLFPAFAASLVVDRARAARLADLSSKLLFLLLLPTMAFLFALASELLDLWLGPEFARHSSAVLRWLAVGVLFNGLAQVPYALVQSAGRPDLTARLHLLELPVYLVGLWWLVRLRGVEGAAAAWTMRVALDTLALTLAARWVLPGVLQMSVRTAWTVGLVGSWLGLMAVASLVPRLLLLAVGLAALGVLSWFRLFSEEERAMVRRLRPDRCPRPDEPRTSTTAPSEAGRSSSRPCRACGNAPGNRVHLAHERMLGLGDPFEYLECASCGCLQLVTPPADWSRYYPSDYYSLAVPQSRRLVRWLKRERARHALGRPSRLGSLACHLWGVPPFARWIAPARLAWDDRVLDIGCGAGQILREMHDAGFTRLTGVDPYVAGDIELGAGARVLRRELRNLDGPFEFVMMNHSFEHVPDPEATLAEIARLLAPGRLLMLRLPVAGSWAWRHYGVDWVQLDAPRHVYLHTEKSLRLMTGRAGFELRGAWFDSGSLQFWGSEQYRLGIPLYGPRSHALDPRASPFSTRQIRHFEARAADLNRRADGDQACFYFERRASA